MGKEENRKKKTGNHIKRQRNVKWARTEEEENLKEEEMKTVKKENHKKEKKKHVPAPKYS